MCLISLAACAIVGPDGNEAVEEVEKTYPDASAFEQVSLHALLEEVPIPADYNVVLYVTGRSICPENAMCFIPDGIVVAEVPELDSAAGSLFIPAITPQQFLLKTPYLFSVHASNRNGEVPARRRIQLLGYSHLSSPAR